MRLVTCSCVPGSIVFSMVSHSFSLSVRMYWLRRSLVVSSTEPCSGIASWMRATSCLGSFCGKSSSMPRVDSTVWSSGRSSSPRPRWVSSVIEPLSSSSFCVSSVFSARPSITVVAAVNQSSRMSSVLAHRHLVLVAHGVRPRMVRVRLRLRLRAERILEM
jgi:hypothetical protein